MPTASKTAPTRAKKTPREDWSDSSHPLAHLIPPKRYAMSQLFLDSNGDQKCTDPCTEHVHGGSYISRSVHGYADHEVFSYAARCEPAKNIRLYGPAGPGKTSMVMAYCATYGIPLVTINANGGIDPNTFFGQWEPKHGVDVAEVMRVMEDVKAALSAKDRANMEIVMPITMAIVGQEKFEFIYSDVVNVIKFGGFLFIDEANFMGGKVSAVWNSLTDGRRFITILDKANEVVQAHPDFQFGIAYNPEYEGTRPLNESFSDRFDIVVHVDYDLEVERELVWMPAMLDMATKLRDGVKQGTLRTPISTRKLIAFEEFCQDIDLDFAIQNFVASFHGDERQAVMEIVRLHETDLREQLEQLNSYDASE